MFMLNKIHFLLILLWTYKKKHSAIFILSTFLIALLSSIFFLSSSIKRDIYATLDKQADFTIQRYIAGRVVNIPDSWVNEFLLINGVKSASGRIYGRHYYEPMEEYFTIIGLDFYDVQVLKEMKTVVHNIDVEEFLKRKNMIIGSGVSEFFNKYHYFDYYTFRPPDRTIEKVYIYKQLNPLSDIVSSDMILMESTNAKKILGVKDGYVSDIILSVPNAKEREMVYTKLRISHFDIRIIQKNEIQQYYENLYNYKGGIFLSLFIVVLLSFALILFQRYSLITTVDAKEVAILRLSGWRVDEVLWLKLSENFIVILAAYLSGIFLAYFYVYFLDAPLLQNIFLGFDNLQHTTSFSPSFTLHDLALIFLLFVTPFMLTILIPLWRVSIQEPTEILK